MANTIYDEDLKDQESQAVRTDDAGADPSGADEQESLKNIEDNYGSGESDESNGNDNIKFTGGKAKRKGKFHFTRAQGIGASLAGILISMIIGVFTFLAPLGELPQLASILSKFSRTSDNAISTRTKGFFKTTRYYRTGDVGETRVGWLGSRKFDKVMKQLESKYGVTIDRRDTSGKPTRLLYSLPDDSPLTSKNPDHTTALKENRANIARHLNLDLESVNQFSGENSGKFHVDIGKMTARNARTLAGTIVEPLGGGKIQTYLNHRILTKFWNAPSLFNPINRAASNLQERVDIRADNRRQRAKAREMERKSRPSKRAVLKEKYTTAKASVKNKLGPSAGIANGVLTLTGALCIVKELADILPMANYAAVVVPAMEEAIDKKAVDSQMRAGDAKLEDVEGVVQSLRDDEGNTVWGGKALNALAYNNEGAGKDIQPEYKQAFTYTGGSIENLINSVLGEQNGSMAAAAEAADATAGVACSTGGLIIQGIASVALVSLGPGGWVVKGGQLASSTVFMAGMMHVLSGLVEDQAQNLGEDILAGPQGGNILAFGERAAINTVVRPMGGIPMSGTEERIAMELVEEDEKNNFRQKNFFARVFDVKDYRSLTASLALPLNRGARSQISGLISVISNPFKFLASSSLLTPRASAATGYDWGFPLYGVPMSILENPDFEDPYDNSEYVSNMLNSDPDSPYIDRAMRCFGVKISKVNNMWDAVPETEVNPLEEEYPNEDCADTNDEGWVRTMLFTFDSSIVTTLDCYMDDEDGSCSRLGIGGGTASTQADTQAEGSTSSASPDQDTSNMSCPEGTTDGGVHQDYGPGRVPTIGLRICNVMGVEGVNAGIAKNALEMLQAGEAAGVGSHLKGSSFRSYDSQVSLRQSNCPDPELSPSSSCRPPTAKAGNSMHEVGLAIDFRQMCHPRGTSCPSNPGWVWLTQNASKFGFKQLSSEAWHWSINGN